MKRQVEEEITRDQIEETIDKYIVLHLNAERNREILKRRLIDGRTHEQLAQEFGLAVQTIQQVLYKYEPVVFNHLRK
jgi:DNA-directed RNA polymerase sigma subunit (sigma70/sigma32)